MLGGKCLRLASLTVDLEVRTCVQVIIYEHSKEKLEGGKANRWRGQQPSVGVIPKKAKS